MCAVVHMLLLSAVCNFEEVETYEIAAFLREKGYVVKITTPSVNDRNLFAEIIDDELISHYVEEKMSKMAVKRSLLIRNLIKINPEYINAIIL